MATAIGALILPFGAASQAYGQSYTGLPEVQTATVVSMRTRAGASTGHPAGMKIAFRFDEPLAPNTLDPAAFLVYSRRGIANQASSATAAGRTVTAFFPTVATRRRATRLSLAATKAGAVRGVDGHGSPIGATGLTRWKTKRGSKSCIRLVGAGPLQHRRHRTIINLTFTSLASCNDGAFGARTTVRRRRLHLEMTNGRSIAARRVRYRSTDPQPPTGRLTVTAIFPGRLMRRHISRITAREGAVVYDWYGGSDDSGVEYNWLQARTIAHRGRTTRPDLVSVKLQPHRRGRRLGHAIFVFDQRVTHLRAKRFLVDNLRGKRARVVRHHPRLVRVAYYSRFFPKALEDATDGSVKDRAVRGGRADEVAIPNNVTYSTLTTGETAGPDLMTGFYLNDSGPLSVGYKFDTELSGPPEPAAFHLYGSDDTEYDAEQCSLVSAESTWQPNYVRCTFPSAARVAKGQAQLATIGAGAVQDASGRQNPEGATGIYAIVFTALSFHGQ